MQEIAQSRLGVPLRNTYLFAASLVIGLSGVPRVALAAYQKRIHGSNCFMQNSPNASFYHEDRGLLNNTASNQIFTCPYDSDTALPHPAVTIVNVHGQKNSPSGTDYVWASVKFWNIFGFDAGIANSTTVSGPWAVSPLLNKWQLNSGADFAYVKVQLSPQSGIFGLFVAN